MSEEQPVLDPPVTPTTEARSFSPRVVLRAMRVHQWVKNFLLFVPLLASHGYAELAKCGAAALGFVIFGLCASAVYLVNDLVDVESDRLHPEKRHRPIASGAMSTGVAKALAVLLFASAGALSYFFLPLEFVAWLATYIVCTTAYSITLKRKLLVDVLTLSALYTLRIMAGAGAIDVEVSHWLLAFSMFIFTSLAFAKRYTETMGHDAESTERIPGRGYYAGDAEIIRVVGPTSGFLAVLVLALYISSPDVSRLYGEPRVLWLVCPVMIYWITRLWFLAHRGQLHHDPITFAMRDTRSYLCVVVLGVVVVLARFLS